MPRRETVRTNRFRNSTQIGSVYREIDIPSHARGHLVAFRNMKINGYAPNHSIFNASLAECGYSPAEYVKNLFHVPVESLG